MYDIVEREINDSIISPDRMKASERKVIVNKLNDYGVFCRTRNDSFVAEKLCTSEPTIYRYLKEIKINEYLFIEIILQNI